MSAPDKPTVEQVVAIAQEHGGLVIFKQVDDHFEAYVAILTPAEEGLATLQIGEARYLLKLGELLAHLVDLGLIEVDG